MFTGIIRALGTLERRELRGTGARLRMRVPELLLANVVLGDSVAVNGVCLTVAARDQTAFEADASAETLSRTTLGALGLNEDVNLEPALRVGDALGGHWVSGHVDAVGDVVRIDADDAAQRWRFRAPRALMRYIAVKGSIAVDGVSLTVNEIEGECFGVTLIPHTLAVTRFARLHVGAAVNLEVDVMARYAERLLAERSAP
jgi:riboflavin synthase